MVIYTCGWATPKKIHLEETIVKVKETVWFKNSFGALYLFEELKEIWYEHHPHERFELGNFNAWVESKGFVRVG